MRRYERARLGLGLDFGDAVESALMRIEEGAEVLPRIHGEVRRCLIGKPFRSYGIFFYDCRGLGRRDRGPTPAHESDSLAAADMMVSWLTARFSPTELALEREARQAPVGIEIMPSRWRG